MRTGYPHGIWVLFTNTKEKYAGQKYMRKFTVLGFHFSRTTRNGCEKQRNRAKKTERTLLNRSRVDGLYFIRWWKWIPNAGSIEWTWMVFTVHAYSFSDCFQGNVTGFPNATWLLECVRVCLCQWTVPTLKLSGAFVSQFFFSPFVAKPIYSRNTFWSFIPIGIASRMGTMW